jgi:TRAP-type C4-dicarboxylate transport system permease small subunit
MAGRHAWTGSVMSGLTNAALTVAAAALIGMTCVQGWQVFARYVLNDSPSWTEPVAQLLVTTAMMFGAAVGVRREAHFGFFIAVHAAPPPVQKVLLTIMRLIVVLVGAVMAMWGSELLIDGWSVPLAGAGFPQGMIFLPIAVGGLLIAVFALEQMFVPSVAEATPAAEESAHAVDEQHL